MADTMISEDELIPISAMQHIRFCKRQCALIHVEQLWAENRFTMEGQQLHERVHAGGHESRRDTRIEFGVRLRSSTLGLAGIADVVEFRAQIDNERRKKWIPYPVEYKRGKQKADDTDQVQLCAQAIALEEMTGEDVLYGAIYYGKDRRRQDITFSPELRYETAKLAEQLRELLQQTELPPPVNDARCAACSLRDMCLPETIASKRRVLLWFEREVLTGEDE